MQAIPDIDITRSSDLDTEFADIVLATTLPLFVMTGHNCYHCVTNWCSVVNYLTSTNEYANAALRVY